MSRFLKALEERVLLCDGGLGSHLQSLDLDIEHDFRGAENCSEILNESRPDVVKAFHRGFLEAGADCVETNTFGGSPITLGEFDMESLAFDLNRRAAELAKETVAEFAGESGSS